MLTLIRVLMVCSVVMIPSLAHGQEICVSTPESMAAAKRAVADITALSKPEPHTGRIDAIDEKLRALPHFPPLQKKTPWGTPVEPFMYGEYLLVQERPVENRFSWYGYRHAELHAKGIIDELLEKTRGKNCCNGVHSGECRVTKYITDGVGKRRVMIDDMSCEITDDTRIVQLDRYAEQDTVVVCAHETFDPVKGYERQCPRTYCIGGGRSGI